MPLAIKWVHTFLLHAAQGERLRKRGAPGAAPPRMAASLLLGAAEAVSLRLGEGVGAPWQWVGHEGSCLQAGVVGSDRL